MKQRIGIQRKFVTLVLVLLVSIAVFIAFFFPQRQKSQMNKYLNDKVLAIAQLIAADASTGLFFDDPESLARTLKGLPLLSGVKFVALYDTNGVEAAKYVAADSGAYKLLRGDIQTLVRSVTTPTNLNIRNINKVALYAEPSMMRGVIVGKVIVGISRSDLETDALESVFIALGVGVAIVVLGGFIMSALSNRLVQPLKGLARAAGRVSAGNLDETVDIQTNDEVEVLAHAFNHMVGNIRRAMITVQGALKKEEEANSRKTELLSIVSHDLKSPIASVLAAIRLIELGDILPEEFPEVGARLRAICERMIELIESLLASSAMEMGKMHIAKADCDAKEIMEQVVQTYSMTVAQKSQALNLAVEGEDFSLHADKGLVKQVLENFTSNAIKYSESGTTITARVVARPNVIRFEVQDQGPGLTEEDKQKLFGFFQRLSARPTGGESSHGVGLAITKRVVDLHDGNIWAESELGKGTTFIVELPRRAAPKAEETSQTPVLKT